MTLLTPHTPAEPTPSHAQRPLNGLRVIEEGAFITGPYAAMLLADMGADVIKVERPGTGDAFRSYDGTLYASTFRGLNHNKRSISIDHQDEADRRVFDELIATADVYLHNFRPGVAERLGLDAERLLDINPRLIHCSISGLGSDGPYAGRPAYDTVAQALSGMLSMTLDPSQPRISGPATADAVTGMYAANGILAALVRRSLDGRGHVVGISMLEAMTHFLSEPYASYFASGERPGPYSRAAVSQSFAMTCSDGSRIALHLSSPERFWIGLLHAVAREDLAADPRFDSRARRVENHEQLRVELQKAFETHPRDHWLPPLAEHDVPHAPVLEPDEALADPQVTHLRIQVESHHPTEGLVRSIRPPHSFDGWIDTDVLAPPTLGEHDDEIREELRALREGPSL
jgi:crotonobetainyl-CoA:carnitine CoA-transferase CaiB-like acyl-CoA transferase